MNCEECQENLSVYLDGELGEVLSRSIRTHLTLCIECAKLCEDFAVILDTCQTEPLSEIIPPNSQALWCRISNTIEGDIKPPPIEEKPSRSRQFSFMQVGSAVLGVALISSLLTVVGIRNYFEPSGEDFTSRSATSQTTFEKVLSKVGLIDTPQQARMRRLKEQEAAIEYWDKRVQIQRAKWDNKIRDAFDRNLNEVNQTVSEYTMILQENPDDDLSGEMLDSALNDKMNLLRDFSEL
ncbi:MAG: zf-HC2 domain-containing protein [Saprospiraceae bacterium]|nr:zf-HC2 domain-containing protein [Pyrinomonadaceae bacterium]